MSRKGVGSMADVKLAVLEKRFDRQEDTVKGRLKELLRKRPYCRGDYRLMYYYFLKDCCGLNINLREFDKLRLCPSPETVGRRFRELQNEDVLFAPSLATQRKRWRNEKLYRRRFGLDSTLGLWL